MAFTITIQPVGGWVLNDMTQPAVFTGGLAAFGPQGEAGSVDVGTVTTLPAGSPATVVNVGTEYAAVLNFGIPEGDKGDKGEKGDTGDTGATGPQGPQGIPGVIAATAPILYNSGTQTVSIDPAYKPNPFNQSLNTDSSVAFESVNLGSLTVDQFGVTFPDSTSQTTAGLSPATAAATYYPLTNPSGFITSSALTGYATESWVGSQGYITSSTAAATYYPLTNPAGYITDIPAASTTVAGKVELATVLEAHTGSNTTLAITPDDLAFRIHSGSTLYLIPSDSSASVSGGTTFVDSQGMGVRCGTASGSFGMRVFAGNNTNGFSATVGGGSTAVNFDKRLIFSGKVIIMSASDAGNYAQRIQFGKTQTTTPIGNLNAKGVGIRSTGAGNALNLLVHNGTTLTAVASSFTPSAASAFDFQIHTDGAGNVTLYVNGSIVATSSAGPTGSSGSLPCVSVESEATAAVSTASNSSMLVCNLRVSFDL